MKLASVRGRAHLMFDDGGVDVHVASDGRFGPELGPIYARWAAFREWAGSITAAGAAAVARSDLGPPVDDPRQIFAIGLNYRAHAMESGLALPRTPLVFTKFASSVTGPYAEIALPTDQTDWEVEVAVVMGGRARNVSPGDGWQYVAGVTAAQDYSARDVQFGGHATPQFSLGKSFPGFTPLGPVLLTPDEFAEPDAIELGCAVNGVPVQTGSTADLIFPVAHLVAYLSSVVTLLPGDVILTGTPSGVGIGRTPPVYLKPGDEVVTWVEGVGEMRHRCVPGTGPVDLPEPAA